MPFGGDLNALPVSDFTYATDVVMDAVDVETVDFRNVAYEMGAKGQRAAGVSLRSGKCFVLAFMDLLTPKGVDGLPSPDWLIEGIKLAGRHVALKPGEPIE